jgi:hypothetical protein
MSKSRGNLSAPSCFGCPPVKKIEPSPFLLFELPLLFSDEETKYLDSSCCPRDATPLKNESRMRPIENLILLIAILLILFSP